MTDRIENISLSCAFICARPRFLTPRDDTLVGDRSVFEDEYYEAEFKVEEYPPDQKTQECKSVLLGELEDNPNNVYYQRQIEIRFEKKYFHWVTDRAIRELKEEEKIMVDSCPIRVGKYEDRLKVITLIGNRYYRRAAKEIARIVAEYCNPSVTRDVGLIGQELFKVAYARYGYSLKKEDAREFNGKKWEKSRKDLDFIVEKGGKYFGCEVKNTLGYIEKKELDEKLEMCVHFGIVPIFILRSAPSVWNDEIIKKGGFVQLFETQIFPPGRKELVDKMRDNLGLPVLTSERIPDSIMERMDKAIKKYVLKEKL